jgi:polyhydroxyalkanoate synthesis repressor PhaR
MSDPEVQTTNPRVIKRYANRKLYDTRESRYVTLPQIAELVRLGEDVQIIDNRTKENLTSVTLAQIIYESEKNAEESSRHGVKTLREMIQAGGERLMAHLREGPVSRLIPKGEIPDLRELREDLRELRENPKLVIAPAIEVLEELQRKTDERVRSVISTVLTPLREAAGELQRLQSRIEELEARLLHRKERQEPAAAAPPATPSPAADPPPVSAPSPAAAPPPAPPSDPTE